MRDKLKGMLWGVALGDALGAPFEFRYGSLPYKSTLNNTSQITDDTEMTLALLNCLSETNFQYDKNKVILSYIKWANSDPCDVGLNTRKLFCHPIIMNDDQALRKYNKVYDELIKMPVSQHSQSNGHLMRASPLAILLVSNKKQDCWVTDTKLTNFHPICIESSKLYFRMIYNLLFNINEPLLIDWTNDIIIQQVIKDVLNIEKTDVPSNRNVNVSRGWTCHSLYFAMIAYHIQFNNFTEAMNYIIGKHLDSDTDTNAAIAGAILGLKYGYDNLIKDEITLKNINILRKCSSNRPEIYHPKRIDEIIEKIEL
jgi:ADP-ribosyl-[dinitrogen reductase] hydrolase